MKLTKNQSWEFCTENFGQYMDYDKYTKWVSEQTDAFYYLFKG